MEKVIFYFDGFNFYIGLKQAGWKKYYWLDMVNFVPNFLNQSGISGGELFLCQAYKKGKQERQDLFFSANKLNPKFNLYLGKYLPKKITCSSCWAINNTFERKTNRRPHCS
ncbi:hypothetical protein [Cytophaga hutchinsonii]|uniref:NYN domain-containing protein n=1 Tax=Cytophaga hutchinsonii (strain ATCC 33406 / DSM 1761 / CIP 103989 / NBRC 15051 / NCIMB 9469 / D465) TaxID=269798 RepID=A0A6N4SVU2_CYTH3|nr:hypothetical protein [Cytophaga hutchinsonii]ABG60592.1 hypothetical protein CHU_3356 [Cytophaga hutchinsonii ATCC 33406]SFX89337.1 hypothetical protein SAMN04487930_11237 [Cytophaga hutchinsonii ATCC 33406]